LRLADSPDSSASSTLTTESLNSGGAWANPDRLAINKMVIKKLFNTFVNEEVKDKGIIVRS